MPSLGWIKPPDHSLPLQSVSCLGATLCLQQKEGLVTATVSDLPPLNAGQSFVPVVCDNGL